MKYSKGDRVYASGCEQYGEVVHVDTVNGDDSPYAVLFDGSAGVVSEVPGVPTGTRLDMWRREDQLTLVGLVKPAAPELVVPRQSDRPRLYLSFPITGKPEHNFPLGNAAAEKYGAMGFAYFNPADTGVIDGWTHDDYMRYDLIELAKCHGIVMLEGWKHSDGCRTEFDAAKGLGLFVIYDSEVSA